jgi:hypothetical protein
VMEADPTRGAMVPDPVLREREQIEDEARSWRTAAYAAERQGAGGIRSQGTLPTRQSSHTRSARSSATLSRRPAGCLATTRSLVTS